MSLRPPALEARAISVISDGGLAEPFDLSFRSPGLGFELAAKKAFIRGVGQSHAQKNRPNRMVARTTRPTETQASGTKDLLARVVCKKPSGQVNETPKRSKEQVFPHAKVVTIPARTTRIRTVIVMWCNVLTLMKPLFFSIERMTSRR